MPKIPPPKQTTVSRIFERHEREAGDWRRDHLGASVIGKSCLRALWYSFRWAIRPDHSGRILRLFERGQREELWILDELRAIGVALATPDEGDQWRVSFLGDHVGGSCDGAGIGFVEAPKTWHVVEAKTSNQKAFKELQSKGVRAAKPEHYDQMQLYMHGLKLNRAFYICVCKNDDEIHPERVHYDRAHAEALLHKAEMVVFSPEPLSKISDDPTWFECRFCDARPICQLGQIDRLEHNCRTCRESIPQREGGWYCRHHEKTLTSQEQRDGCKDHRSILELE